MLGVFSGGGRRGVGTSALLALPRISFRGERKKKRIFRAIPLKKREYKMVRSPFAASSRKRKGERAGSSENFRNSVQPNLLPRSQGGKKKGKQGPGERQKGTFPINL